MAAGTLLRHEGLMKGSSTLSSRFSKEIARAIGNKSIREELAWVAVAKMGDFLLLFALLKVLTTSLGKSGYGEYNLAETSLVLLAAALLAPVSESFIRELHHARSRGEGRHAGTFLLRWYVSVTLGIAACTTLFSAQLGAAFDVRPSTVAAGGVAFVADRWRILGLEVWSMRRQRRRWALQSVAYSGVLLGAMAAAMSLGDPTPGLALAVYASVAALFAIVGTAPVVREILTLPHGPKSSLAGLVVGFGIPFGLLLLLQWVQGFADRFLIKALLDDAAAVGLYAAAFQACGAPFTLLYQITHNLLRPIAYQQADATRPESLWAADRLLLLGIASQVATGIAATAFLIWLGPRLIVLLTDSSFQVSRATVAALTIGRLAQMTCASIQPMFAVHHAMNRLLNFRFGGAVLTLLLCFPLTKLYGIFGTALGTSIALTGYFVALSFMPGGAASLLMSARRAHGSITKAGLEAQQGLRDV